MVSEQTKHTLDVLSLGTVLASLAAWLPPIAALMSIIWTFIRIYETPTVQRLVAKLAKRKTPQPGQEN